MLLTVVAVGAVFTGAFTVARVRDVLNETEHRLYVHNWHMRELIPASERDAAPAKST